MPSPVKWWGLFIFTNNLTNQIPSLIINVTGNVNGKEVIGMGKNNLTERFEIRITKKMKSDAVKISKRYDVSIGEVMRMGLFELMRREESREG